MPADLTTASLIVRQSLVLDDDALVILESRGGSSRVWRVPYLRVRRLTLHQRLPAGRMAVVFLLLTLPGAALLLIDDDVAWVFAGILIGLSLVILTWYAVCRKTRLRFEYSTSERELEVIARPKRLRRFTQRFSEAVRRVHASTNAEEHPATSP